MPTALIALGGNLGDVLDTFRRAIDDLTSMSIVEVTAKSSLYETAPMGAASTSAYLNAVLAVETASAPHTLLRQLQACEQRHGRTRHQHWGSRTIDLDLIAYGSEVMSTDDLVLPHPGLWYRRFVLDPLVDVAPDWIHPVREETARELQTRLMQRPLPIVIDGAHTEALIKNLKLASIADEITLQLSSSSEAAIRFCVTGMEGTTGDADPHRVVTLPEQNASELTLAVLTAALDAPQKIATDI